MSCNCRVQHDTSPGHRSIGLQTKHVMRSSSISSILGQKRLRHISGGGLEYVRVPLAHPFYCRCGIRFIVVECCGLLLWGLVVPKHPSSLSERTLRAWWCAVGLATWESCQSCCSRLRQFSFLCCCSTAPASETKMFYTRELQTTGICATSHSIKGLPELCGPVAVNNWRGAFEFSLENRFVN